LKNCKYCSGTVQVPDYSKVMSYKNTKTKDDFCSLGCIIAFYKNCRYCKSQQTTNKVDFTWEEPDENKHRNFLVKPEIGARFCEGSCQEEFEELYGPA